MVGGSQQRFRKSLELLTALHIRAALLPTASKATLASGTLPTHRTFSHIPAIRREVRADAVVSYSREVSSTKLNSLMPGKKKKKKSEFHAVQTA